MDIVFTMIMGFALGFSVSLMIFTDPSNVTDNVQRHVICEYEGGTVEGEVCIVDGRVFDIRLGD